MADETSLPSTPAAPSRKKRAFPGQTLSSGKGLWILVIVILLAAVGGVFWWLHISQYEQTDNATLTGHVHPVSSRVAGNILKVLVNDNQLVQAGQVIAVVDPKDYQIALSQAEHNLAQAKAQADTALHNIAYTQKQAASQLTQAQGGVGSSQSGISQSRQSVSEATAAVSQARHTVDEQQATYQKSLADYNRYRNVDPDAISGQQLDTAATTLKNSEAALQASQAALAQAQARLSQSRSAVTGNVARLTQSKGVIQSAQAQALQVGVVKSQYESAKAAVAVAEDAVRQAKLNLSYTAIKAPASGRIGRKTVEVGQRVQGGEPLMSVVSPDVWVIANFKETQLERMRPGQPVDIHVDAFPHHPFKGTVQSFSPASGAEFALLPPENATGNFTKIVQRIPVKILLDAESVKDFQDLLVPGMSTVISVNVAAPARENHNNAGQ